MLDAWQPLGFLAAVVGFWMAIFIIAIVMTRWALRGVGEPLATEATGGDASVGASHGSPATESGKATTGGRA